VRIKNLISFSVTSIKIAEKKKKNCCIFEIGFLFNVGRSMLDVHFIADLKLITKITTITIKGKTNGDK